MRGYVLRRDRQGNPEKDVVQGRGGGQMLSST